MRFYKVEKTEALENGWAWVGLGLGLIVGGIFCC